MKNTALINDRILFGSDADLSREEQELYIALLDEDSFTEYKRLYGGPAGDARRWALNCKFGNSG